MNKKKAQAAIDMLISYSIAILVISIALYVVLQLGIFNNRLAPQYCNASPSFTCSSATIASNGDLLLSFSQDTPGIMYITGAACASFPNSTATGPAYGNIHVLPYSTVPNYYPSAALQGGITAYSSNQTRILLTCYTASGIARGNLGNTFSGYVWINYTFTDLPGNYHSVQQLVSFNEKYSSASIVTTTSTSSTTTSTSSTFSSSSTTTTATSSSSSTTTATTILYTYFGTTQYTDPISVTGNSGYNWYFCGSTDGYPITYTSYSEDSVTGTYSQYTSIGHQTSNTCSAGTGTYAEEEIAGAGIDAPSYTVLASSNSGSSTSFSFNYNVADSGQLTVIILSGVYFTTSLYLPSGCNLVETQDDSPSTTYVAICSGQAVGTQTVSGTTYSSPIPEYWVVYGAG